METKTGTSCTTLIIFSSDFHVNCELFLLLLYFVHNWGGHKRYTVGGKRGGDFKIKK